MHAIPIIWETVYEQRNQQNFIMNESVKRSKIYSGWIIVRSTFSVEGQFSEQMIYVPDASHFWKVKDEEK